MSSIFDRTVAALHAKLEGAKSELRSEIDAAASRLGAQIAGAALRGVIWLLAGLLLVVAIAVATFALYAWLRDTMPPAEAAGIVAGLYAALALLAALAAGLVRATVLPADRTLHDAFIPQRAVEGLPAPARALPAAVPEALGEPAGGLQASARSDDASQSGRQGDLAAVGALLDAIGLSRERDALTIVEAAAKSLPAPQLILTGLLTGLILARRVDLSRRHRRLRD